MLSKRAACLFALLLVPAALRPVIAAESEFPFGAELMLEGESSRAHKRLPMIQVDEDGTTTLDLRCGSMRTQATVGADGSIAIAPGVRNNGQCDPERVASDDDLLDMMLHLTSWRREGDLVEFSGAPGTMRFRMMTN
jgi:hypothetical protein